MRKDAVPRLGRLSGRSAASSIQYEGGGSGGGGSSYGVLSAGLSALTAGFGNVLRGLGAFGSALAFVVIDAVTEGAADAVGLEPVPVPARALAPGTALMSGLGALAVVGTLGAVAVIDTEGGGGEAEGAAVVDDARCPSR